MTFYCSESDLTDILFHFQVSTFITTTLLPLRGIPPPHPHVRKAGGKMREDERRSGHERNRNRVHVLSALLLCPFSHNRICPGFRFGHAPPPPMLSWPKALQLPPANFTHHLPTNLRRALHRRDSLQIVPRELFANAVRLSIRAFAYFRFSSCSNGGGPRVE